MPGTDAGLNMLGTDTGLTCWGQTQDSHARARRGTHTLGLDAGLMYALGTDAGLTLVGCWAAASSCSLTL